MAKKKESIEIPIDLARLLASEPDDFKKPEEYENVQAVAKSLLRLMLNM